DQNEAYLYDVVTGKLDAVLRGHRAPVTSVAYRPDGKQVATIGNDQALRLWAPATGREVALFKADVAPPNLDRDAHVVYSPDGKRIASATSGNDIHLWDGESGKAVAVLRGHSSSVSRVQFSPDGSRLVSGSQYPDNTACLWDAATGRLLFPLAGHKNE